MLVVLRILLVLVNFILVSVFGTAFCLFRPFHSGNAWVFARYFAFFGRTVLGIQVTIENEGVIRNAPPSVYISNHQSNLDIFLTGNVIFDRLVSIGKKSLKYIPFFGTLYWLSGNILIDRRNAREAIRSMDRESRRVITENRTSVWIFPEGTRNPNETLLPFKKGAFHTAIKAKVPIVPVCISSYTRKLDFRKLRSGHVKIVVLNPIPTTDHKIGDAGRISQHCREIMQKTIDRINAEIQ